MRTNQRELSTSIRKLSEQIALLSSSESSLRFNKLIYLSNQTKPQNEPLMKKIVLLTCLIAINFMSKSQTLGGYPIIGYLEDAVHPNGCVVSAVTGPPDDSTWVNLTVGDTMSGTFGNPWIDSTGNELLLETSFNTANYDVRLRLSSGLYSSTHAVSVGDWTAITDTTWVYVETNCNVTVFFPHNRYVLPLDFNTHFGLGATDAVDGIEIVFLTSTSGPDLAGIHIIGGTAVACDTIDLGNDTTVCNGQGLVLDATYPDATYLWQEGSSDPSFFANESGEYWVSVTTDCGVFTDTIDVIIANVNPIIIDAGGSVLECTAPFFSYQWYYNDTLIPGATDQNHTILNNGSYYVVVIDSNECEGTSNTIELDLVNGLRELSKTSMSIFPNPNLGRFTLSASLLPNEVSVYNSLGQMLLIQVVNDEKELLFDLSVAGVYFIHARFDDGVLVRKVIVR